MERIKEIAVVVFFVLLLASNFGMIVERLLVVLPGSQFSFAGTNGAAITADLNDGPVAIGVDKMNVFYIGVNNPITVAASSIASKYLELSAKNAMLKSVGNGQYTVTCSKPGKAVITVQNRKTSKTKNFEFRIKRIPDPIVRLGKQTNGLMLSGEFKAQLGLIACMDNFDFDAKCKVVAYTLYYTQKGMEPIELKGTGGRFEGEILNTTKQAKPGDQYAFTNVKARCPGDVASRKINGLSFKIK